MKQWIPLAISKKIHYFRSFRSKAKKTSSSLPLHMCLESFALFYGDFCMYLFSVDSNEAMKR